MDRPFVIFAYDSYYPVGGWNDFHSRHATLEDAQAGIDEAKANSIIPGHPEQVYTYYDIVNVETGEKLEGESWSSSVDYCGGHKWRDYGYGIVCRDCGTPQTHQDPRPTQ